MGQLLVSPSPKSFKQVTRAAEGSVRSDRARSDRVSIGLISRQRRRAEVFIKARWVALVRPVGLLLALTEALRAP